MIIVVAFDVDNTLIWQEADLVGGVLVPKGEPAPHYKNIDLFKHFERCGCHMVIWSGGGMDYAKRWAEKLGLKAEIREKKLANVVDIAVDDQDVILGKVNLKV